MKIDYMSAILVRILYEDILKTKTVPDNLKPIFLNDILEERRLAEYINIPTNEYNLKLLSKIYREDVLDIFKYVDKYHITDNISSLSNDALKEYIEDLEKEAENDIENMYMIFGDIISDLVIIDLFIERNERDFMKVYIKNWLHVKYAVQYVEFNMEYGVKKFDSEEERSDYISKCITLFDKSVIEQKALEFIKYKFHVLCMFTYVYEVDYIKEIIHDYCTEGILFDILDDPNRKILHGRIQDMGFDTY